MGSSVAMEVDDDEYAQLIRRMNPPRYEIPLLVFLSALLLLRNWFLIALACVFARV